MVRIKRELSSAERRVRRHLAENIEHELKRRGWSVVLLADRSDVSKTLLYALLDCESAVTIDALTRLSRPLGVEPWELLRPQR